MFISRIRYFLLNTCIKNKMLGIIILFTLCIYITFISGINIIIKQYTNELHEKMATILNMSILNIENELDEIARLSESIIGDELIQQQLIQSRQLGTNIEAVNLVKNIQGRLYRYINQGRHIQSICIENEKIKAMIGIDLKDQSNQVKKLLYEQARAQRGKEIWQEGDSNSTSILCSRQINQIQHLKLDELGFLTIEVNLDKIVNEYLYNVLSTKFMTEIYIVNEDGRLIYPRKEEASLKKGTYSEMKNDRYNILKCEGEKYLSVNRNSGYTGWEYQLFTPFDTTLRGLNTLKNSVITVIWLSFIIYIVFVGKMVDSIVKHFEWLTYKMHLFKDNNLEIIKDKYDYESRGDEIAFIHNSFNSMAKQIKFLVDENYTKQLLIKDAEIQALQQQIDPHFLFNTLESINWLAKLNKQEKIAMMITSLGNLLRTNIYNKQILVSIKDEIVIVENYMNIQKIRYGERLQFKVDLDYRLEKVVIPKMSIQPIVENAINYGIENTLEVYEISIAVKGNKAYTEIAIQDNGPGIDEDIINRLKNNEVMPKGMGVGLINIDQRIKLIFSNEYGISIENTLKGTKVVIKVPTSKEEKICTS